MKIRSLILSVVAAMAVAAMAANAQVPGINSTLNSVFTLAYDNSTMKPTYSATVNVVLASTATDVCTITGSATKTIKVRRVTLTGVAGASTTEPIAFIKRSTIDTGGSAIVTPVSYDSQFSAATATSEAFTSNASALGTVVGTITDPLFTFGNVGTGGAQAFPAVYKFGELGAPVVLRGATQNLAVNLNNLTITNGQLGCTFEWTEE